MPHIPYKYNLHSLLRNLSQEDYEIAMEFLPEICQVTKRTFIDWIYRKAFVSKDIPSESVQKMCVFFEIETRDFYNSPVCKDKLKNKFKKFKEKHLVSLSTVSQKTT
ncbi:hypothetical protein [Lishizhenia sp.]|uniref:hypothetical protein n=1 Tax=Lishizhenia sp. TaxID=2497594 RepID=UPI00299EB376|nr:hypothetical protein [Lishizhenia sp.]MDX1446242.1 hypothetical protein [Lishizhenia sp.]